jgi:hypothetical protein
MTALIDESGRHRESRRLPWTSHQHHLYPTDPLGFEGANTEEQLSAKKPAQLHARSDETGANSRERPIYFTEWNISSKLRGSLPRRVVRGSLRGKDRPRDWILRGRL